MTTMRPQYSEVSENDTIRSAIRDTGSIARNVVYQEACRFT